MHVNILYQSFMTGIIENLQTGEVITNNNMWTAELYSGSDSYIPIPNELPNSLLGYKMIFSHITHIH